MKVSRRRRNEPQIPLSAMSDIALLLLIFFIVTTQFLVQRALNPQLPSMTHEKDKQSKELITVMVHNDCVFLDEERIQMEDLAPFLAAKLADRVTDEERSVAVDGPPDIRYENVVTAMNEVLKAGGIPTVIKVEE